MTLMIQVLFRILLMVKDRYAGVYGNLFKKGKEIEEKLFLMTGSSGISCIDESLRTSWASLLDSDGILISEYNSAVDSAIGAFSGEVSAVISEIASLSDASL